MNAHTGATYRLGEDLTGASRVGQPIIATEFLGRMDALERQPTPDEAAAAAALRQDQAIVAVNAQVVQRLRLGDRELRRRKQRR